MYYNYRTENRAFEEPAAILFTTATRENGIPPPLVRPSWDSRHPPPESVQTDGRTLTSEPKFFGSTGYQIFLPMVLCELRYQYNYGTAWQACQCCLPRIPSCRIVYGLYFAPDNVLSIRCSLKCAMTGYVLAPNLAGLSRLGL